MKKIFLALFITLCVLEFGPNVFVVSDAPEKSCKSVLQDLTKLQLGLMGQCGKSMKFKNGKEKAKKQNCIMRCALIKAELVNEKGQVTLESVDYLLHKFMPPSLLEKANSTFFPCMEIGIKQPFKSLEEDPFCSDFDPFIKCFMQRVGGLCS